MAGSVGWTSLVAWDADARGGVSAAFEEAMFASAAVEARQDAEVRRAVAAVVAAVAEAEAGADADASIGRAREAIGPVVEAARERVAVREAQKRVNRVRVDLQHTLLLLARSWDALGDSAGDRLPRRIDKAVVADATHTRHVLLRVLGVREVPVRSRTDPAERSSPGLAVAWKEGRARDLRREARAGELRATLRWVKEAKAERNLIRITAGREEQRVLGVHLRYHEGRLDAASREALLALNARDHATTEEEEEEEEEEGEEALPWRASFLVPVEADEERDADACRLCGEAGAALQCSGCRDAKYCGEVCQRIHWRTEHREMCRAGQGGNGGARAGASESESDAEGLDLDGLTLDV